METALKSHLGQTKTERNQAAKETPSESVNSDGVLLFEKGYKRFFDHSKECRYLSASQTAGAFTGC